MRIALGISVALIVVLSAYFLIRTFRRSHRETTNGPNTEPTTETTTMIFKDDQGQEVKPEDLTDYTGAVNWSILDQKDIPEAAQELLKRGQEAGAANNSQEALRLFAEATKIAPGWAYPIYEAAFTHLLIGDLEKAERDYLQVEKLEPRGFFTYQSELDCVRRERSGEFKPGTCRRYLLLADMPASDQKRLLLQRLLDDSPSLPPAWDKFSILCDTDQDRLVAIEKGLASRPDPQTRGNLLLNKALVLYHQGRQEEAITLLNHLVSAPDSSLDTVSKAKFTISNLSDRSKH